MHRIYRIWFWAVWCLVILGIRTPATDHRPTRLVLQQLPVLLILCILCIDVFFCSSSSLLVFIRGSPFSFADNPHYEFQLRVRQPLVLLILLILLIHVSILIGDPVAAARMKSF